MKTIFIKESDIQKKWYIVDVAGKPLGRVAAKIASILRGKHKVTFSPHQDAGDYVIVINASKVALSGTKEKDKMYYRHSGYVGGLKSINFKQLIQKKPEDPITFAVKGMLPKGRLGRQMLGNLKAYAGATHPHSAQNPVKLEI
ncbi:MAG: 50S ribosomal protein L13 [Treponema sp.]